MSDIIEPSAYISLPFVNQAFFVAGCCYIKGRPYPDCMVSGLIPRRYRIATTASNSRSQPPLPPYRVIHNHPSFERTSLRRSRTRETERSLSGLTSIRLLVKHHHSEARSRDFSGPAGVAWVAAALDQRLSGVDALAIDLVSATDNLQSSVSVPDACLFTSSRGGRDVLPVSAFAAKLNVDISGSFSFLVKWHGWLMRGSR